jgi:hypothetical protein
VVGVLVVVADVGPREDVEMRGVETNASSKVEVGLEVLVLIGVVTEVSSLVLASLDVSLGIKSSVIVDVVPGKSVKMTPPSPTQVSPTSQQPYSPLSPRVQ